MLQQSISIKEETQMEQTILSGDERREKLLALLLRSDEPLSGGKIGDIYHVSRQVVVQDIALLYV